eukprot:gene4826-biopygen2348
MLKDEPLGKRAEGIEEARKYTAELEKFTKKSCSVAEPGNLTKFLNDCAIPQKLELSEEHKRGGRGGARRAGRGPGRQPGGGAAATPGAV